MRSGLAAELGKVGLDAGLERGGGGVVRADDEDGVVAGDGADDLVPLFRVERGGDGLSAAHGGDAR